MTYSMPSFRQSTINVLSLWGHRIGGVLVALIITPIITRHFGLERMGIWMLVSQFAQHIMLLELGINTSLTRFLAKHRAQGDLAAASRYLSTAVFGLLAIGGIVVLSAPLLTSGFEFSFNLTTESFSKVHWLVLLASITTGLNLPLRAGIGMLSSSHRFNRLAMWQTLALSVRLLLVLIFFFCFNPDLLTLGIITFIPTLLGNLMLFRDGLYENRDLQINYRLLSRREIWSILSVSGATIIITLSALVVRQSSSMLVGYKLGSDQVAVIAFPILIVSMVTPIVGLINRLVVPVASQLAARDRIELIYDISKKVCRYQLSLTLLILIAFHFLGYLLIELWLGGPKVDRLALHQMSKILVIIFSGFVLATPGLVIRSVLISVGEHWPAAGAEIIGALLGIGCGLLLMARTELETTGMAIGIFFAFFIRGTILLSIRGAAFFSVPYVKLLWNTANKPLTVAGISMLISSVFSRCFLTGVGNWWDGGIAFSIAAIVWFAGVWFWIMDNEHKSKIIAKVHLFYKYNF